MYLRVPSGWGRVESLTLFLKLFKLNVNFVLQFLDPTLGTRQSPAVPFGRHPACGFRLPSRPLPLRYSPGPWDPTCAPPGDPRVGLQVDSHSFSDLRGAVPSRPPPSLSQCCFSPWGAHLFIGLVVGVGSPLPSMRAINNVRFKLAASLAQVWIPNFCVSISLL